MSSSSNSGYVRLVQCRISSTSTMAATYFLSSIRIFLRITSIARPQTSNWWSISVTGIVPAVGEDNDDLAVALFG